MGKNRKVIVCLLLVLSFAAGSIDMYHVSAASDHGARADEKTIEQASFDNAAVLHYQRWLSENYSAGVCTNGRWLCDMADALALDWAGEDMIAVYRAAYDSGLLDRYDAAELYSPLTRAYAAHTLVRALGYESRSVGHLADADEGGDLDTVAYFGYFLPDDQDRIRPDAAVTDDEYSALLSELVRYRALSGKTVMSFGDSIMYGRGNDSEGISDMIALKYGMTSLDYSVSGATMGVYQQRGHIPDQVRVAKKAGVSANVILLNGGTNDMLHVAMGTIKKDRNMAKVDEGDYTGGFEKTLWLCDRYWSGVPVIYIRVHDMDACADSTERKFGERALAICDKWEIPYVDLYSDSGFNAEDADICQRYTFPNPKVNYRCDSIHPTALGYAKYYLPPISQAVAAQLIGEITDD